MGHQASFCLTPAFTGCPIFLDWASRVAADVAIGGCHAARPRPRPRPSSPERPPPDASDHGRVRHGRVHPTGVPPPSSRRREVRHGRLARARDARSLAAALAAVAMTATVPTAVLDPSVATAAATAGAVTRPRPDLRLRQPPSGPRGADGRWARAPPRPSNGSRRPRRRPDIYALPTKRVARLDIDTGVRGRARDRPRAWLPGRGAAGRRPSMAARRSRHGDRPGGCLRRRRSSGAAAAELAASMARTDLVVGSNGPAAAAGRPRCRCCGDRRTATSDGSGAPPWSRGRPRVPVDAGAPSSLGPQTQTRPRALRGPGSGRARAGSRRTRRDRRRAARPPGARRHRRGARRGRAAGACSCCPSLFLGGGAAPTADAAATSGRPVVAATGAPRPRRPHRAPRPERPPSRRRAPTRSSAATRCSSIGRRFNVTVEQLTCANDIRNPNSLSVGHHARHPHRVVPVPAADQEAQVDAGLTLDARRLGRRGQPARADEARPPVRGPRPTAVRAEPDRVVAGQAGLGRRSRR